MNDYVAFPQGFSHLDAGILAVVVLLVVVVLITSPGGMVT
jgi:hypothetical protein